MLNSNFTIVSGDKVLFHEEVKVVVQGKIVVAKITTLAFKRSFGITVMVRPSSRNPLAKKNSTWLVTQYWNKYTEEVKELFEKEIDAFKNRVAVSPTDQLETLAPEHSEVL